MNLSLQKTLIKLKNLFYQKNWFRWQLMIKKEKEAVIYNTNLGKSTLNDLNKLDITKLSKKDQNTIKNIKTKVNLFLTGLYEILKGRDKPE